MTDEAGGGEIASKLFGKAVAMRGMVGHDDRLARERLRKLPLEPFARMRMQRQRVRRREQARRSASTYG